MSTQSNVYQRGGSTNSFNWLLFKVFDNNYNVYQDFFYFRNER